MRHEVVQPKLDRKWVSSSGFNSNLYCPYLSKNNGFESQENRGCLMEMVRKDDADLRCGEAGERATWWRRADRGTTKE